MSQSGFTLAETLVAVACIAIGAGTAVPSVAGHLERSRVERAAQDIVRLEGAIVRYRHAHQSLPDTLDQLGTPVPNDPWGNPYEYVNFVTRGLSEQRNFHNLPLNSDYDLYSRGSDGQTDLALNAVPARDDVVRARDGDFVGPATDF